jgi:hypothetical protein
MAGSGPGWLLNFPIRGLNGAAMVALALFRVLWLFVRAVTRNLACG